MPAQADILVAEWRAKIKAREKLVHKREGIVQENRGRLSTNKKLHAEAKKRLDETVAKAKNDLQHEAIRIYYP